MKHLIARHSNCLVVGLKDRAYLVLDAKAGNDSTSKSIIELARPPDTKANSAAESSASTKTSKDSSDPTKDSKDEQKPPKPKIHDRRKSADEQLNEISAVGVIGHNDTLHCAVTRNNKAMHIYTIKLQDLPTKTSQPSLHYRTPKRVSSFAFANIPPNNDTSSKVPLLISVDLAGDSYAYDLVKNGQRLLLGHTASMLTDVAITRNNGNGDSDRLILTSDRDEKIRISRFPETYIMEGFLLGHTAFVTGFVALPWALVVSCGGDMTLRLWDLQTQVEISSTSTSNDENSNANAIPTAIAASSCGHIVAVIFDDSRRLSIYKINKGEGTEKPSLELLSNVECPAQPLSIVFNGPSTAGSDTSTELTVLMKDPDYLAVYDVQHTTTKEEVVAILKNEIGVLQALRDVASDNKIAMPNTILEKDDYGKPVLQKENETRGPAAEDAPWNRVERIEIAKEREKRKKKKQKLAVNDS